MQKFQTLLGSALIAFTVASAQAAEAVPQRCIVTNNPNPGDLAVTLLKEPVETWDVAVLKGYGDDTLNTVENSLDSTLKNMWGGNSGYFTAVFISGSNPNESKVPGQPVAAGLKALVDREMVELNKHGSIMPRDRQDAKNNAMANSKAAFQATLADAHGKIQEALALPKEQAVCDKPVIIQPDVKIDIAIPPVDIPPLAIPIIPADPAAMP
jgi:hypothetical protein